MLNRISAGTAFAEERLIVKTASVSPELPSAGTVTSLTDTVGAPPPPPGVTVMLTVATFESTVSSFALKVNESGPL